jgi:hypothetical protein
MLKHNLFVSVALQLLYEPGRILLLGFHNWDKIDLKSFC